MVNKLISMNLYEHLKHSDTFGLVHSKFNRSINILLHDDVLITLLNDTKDLAPMSAVCDHKTFNGLALEIGERITTKGLRLYSGDRILVDFSEYTNWEKIDRTKLSKYSQKEHKEAFNILYKKIMTDGKLDGIASIIYFFDEDVLRKNENLANGSIELKIEKNHYVNFIIDRLERFLQEYKNCNLLDIGDYFIKIIGFGPGLTPSVDDYICGLFSMSKNLCEFYGVSDHYISKLAEKLLESLHQRTTRISEEMIKHCFKNNISKTYDALLTNLLYESKYGLEASIDRVIEFGDTSGTDFLSGVYTACKLFDEYTIRRKFDGCKV